MRPSHFSPFVHLVALACSFFSLSCGAPAVSTGGSDALRAREQVLNPEGKASDLGKLSPRSLIRIEGKFVLSCPALEQQRPSPGSFEGFRSFCEEQNNNLKASGYSGCPVGQCVESWHASTGGSRSSIELVLKNITPGDYWSLSFRYVLTLGEETRDKDSFVCKVASELWEKALWKEKSTWSFQRYTELCLR